MSTISLETTIGQLVAEQPARSEIFERYGISYCCGGRRTLETACAEQRVDVKRLLGELAAVDDAAPPPAPDWAHASITHLCDHIEAKHHTYARHALSRLSELVARVSRAHGGEDPRLGDLRVVFARFQAEFESHISKEELYLFPLCRELDRPDAAAHGSVQNPIRMMVAEHNDTGVDLRQMHALTDGFAAPEWACNTYLAMLHGLRELEADTREHIHLENNILFVKALECETVH